MTRLAPCRGAAAKNSARSPSVRSRATVRADPFQRGLTPTPELPPAPRLPSRHYLCPSHHLPAPKARRRSKVRPSALGLSRSVYPGLAEAVRPVTGATESSAPGRTCPGPAARTRCRPGHPRLSGSGQTLSPRLAEGSLGPGQGQGNPLPAPRGRGSPAAASHRAPAAEEPQRRCPGTGGSSQ